MDESVLVKQAVMFNFNEESNKVIGKATFALLLLFYQIRIKLCFIKVLINCLARSLDVYPIIPDVSETSY